jgi:hypothetical protein
MLLEAAGLGVLIGLFLGGLGGGGGVLVVPALVYLLGQTAQNATTSSIIIVGLTAVAATIARIRSGLVDWRTGLAFGVVGIPTAYLGTLLNHHVPQRILLLAFAVLTIAAAVAMLLDNRGPATPDPGGDPSDTGALPDPSTSSGTGTLLDTRSATRTRAEIVALVSKVLVCGLAVGFLTGFLGVGGGFLVVPALVIALRMPMTYAIGTSLMIVALNSVSSLVSRIGVAEFEWKVLVPFTLAAIVASVAGKRLADRLSGTVLTRSFAIMLVLVGALVGAQSLGAF